VTLRIKYNKIKSCGSMIYSTEAVGVYVLSSVVFHNWWAGERGAWIDERNK
jgi:hypothetical protein